MRHDPTPQELREAEGAHARPWFSETAGSVENFLAKDKFKKMSPSPSKTEVYWFKMAPESWDRERLCIYKSKAIRQAFSQGERLKQFLGK